jgi:hypothetical protein
MMRLVLAMVVSCFLQQPTVGILWREKSRFSPRSKGNITRPEGKYPRSSSPNNCTGHCSNIIDIVDCNCNVLPLSLDDLLNYTTLMLKFCTNKPIWVSLLRQVFFWGGEGCFAQKKGVTLHPWATDFREKKILRKLNTYCKLL